MEFRQRGKIDDSDMSCDGAVQYFRDEVVYRRYQINYFK